jgi:hypothetical protein
VCFGCTFEELVMKKVFDLIDPKELKVTVVLPAYQMMHKLPFTLESLCAQTHNQLDCILLVKEPIEELHSLVFTWSHQMNLHIYTLQTSSLSRAYNRGVMLASGDYVQLMSPGDRYLSAHSLSKIVELAVENFLPDLVYTGTFQSLEDQAPGLWYRSFDLPHLKKGLAPTKLSACLIKRDCLLEEGKLADYCEEMAQLDWFCRMKALGSSFVCDEYYSVESQGGKFSASERMRAITQMTKVIYHHFGLAAAAVSWISQKPLSHFLKSITQRQKAHMGSNIFSLN